MSTTSTSIQLSDSMTPVLLSITSAMNLMYSSFSTVQNAAASGIDAASFQAARQEIINASVALGQYREEMMRIRNASASPPEPPSWNRAAAPEVFMNSGVQRFANEYQAANQMAQQLYRTQQSISAQVSRMPSTPPGMVNDMAAVSNRVQSLANRIQELDQIPVELKTDQMNNEIESLRVNLSQAAQVQEDLNQAIMGMDVNAANEAYQRLNSILDSSARNIRAGTASQEQYNRSQQEGQNMAGELGDKIRAFAQSIISADNLETVVQFSLDAVSLYEVQNEAEAKLQDVMQQRMGASPASVQGINDLITEQQQSGVVSDEVQLSGAQQLAAFLNTDSALATLIPAMNDLAVGQSGINVSSQDMAETSDIMGRAMQGQVEALTEVGLTFTEAQQKILEYGNEQERAAALAEIITNNVGNMNGTMGNTPEGQIQQMTNAWRNIKEEVGARLYPAVMRFFEALNANMPQAGNVVMGLSGVLNILLTGFSYIVEAAGVAAGFILDNWSIIEPVIWGVLAALTAYGAYLAITNGLEAMGNGIKMISVIAQYAYAAATGTVVAENTAAAASQMGFNTALLACPLTWIVLGIIALVTAIYVGVAAFNKFTGESVSATGVVAAVFGVMAANVYNIFVYIWNIVAAFINFFYNVWRNPVAAVKILFYDLALNVIGYIANMAHAIEDVINNIPGVEVNITAGLDRFQSQLKSASDKAKDESEWVEIVSSKEFKDYSDSASSAYDWGAEKENQIKDALDGFGLNTDLGTQPAVGLGMESIAANTGGIAANTGGTAANTAAMADSMDMMDEDLKYMRDVAEQEIINRFTLSELKVDVNNSNTLTTQTDFDDVNRRLADVTGEILAVAAEGGHL